MTHKRYRIEDSLGLPPAAGTTMSSAGPVEGGARLDEILSAIQDLRRITQSSAGETIEACRRELSEALAMRSELDVMKAAITNTRDEIAALYHSESNGKGMRRAADELGAVVGSTERATSTLLTALEEIEASANILRAGNLGKGGQDKVDVILDRVIVAYEACNFQDLTGQRISKIVNVLSFVESHLDRMIAAWSGLDGFRDVFSAGPAAVVDPDDERSLLNGPKLDEDPGHVDQSDIDALFG
ncbi:chemotaxis protein [Methylobacterium sp. E-041]|jgi:chemotaxis protein CheZ|uniref:chemotaxis protein n=1 Tax=unclassified Methylobacterium TaxID=2615210 RepID=UPI0011CC1A24|nr:MULTISPECIES: chemotaxis protein [unclassified Methylobacterium]MCJ2007495.1 chemotaxis protein [Methylobacterium sp. J-092]MCJ2041348.1 chemotaxis protein [Methylobacterium sp. J-059]MCJ2104456.1 chemotaxis protein [Methylobacterium sp. E-041]MCJ2111665.1 chemotaxis protein [Methylobacterium sp. E-025]TXN61549.1 chemotaxis protein [Methylobacterium sp. WL6]